MLNRDITMEDMVKIIQHISNKRTLTEEEIKEYDCNDNGIVNMDDFIMSFEMLMKGPYEHRSWKNYNIFKAYAHLMPHNLNLKDKFLIICNSLQVHTFHAVWRITIALRRINIENFIQLS